MATYVNDLRLKEIATGDEAGTWGTSTNTNLELIGEALGYGTQDCFSTDADATTTVADGATDPARAMYFKVTSSATLTAGRTLTIAPNTISRVMFIENATTGSQVITISQGTGGNVAIANGKTAVVYLDGAGSGAAVVDAMALVDPGITDTLAEVLVAGNTSGGTGLTMSSGDDLTLTGASYNVVWDSSDSALEFGDNAKAIFGAGSDLQIYHDGSNSYITDSGTGNLRISGTLLQLNDASFNKYLLGSGDSVTLYNADSAKLATTSTGIDVTGSISADGLTVDGAATLIGNITQGNGDLLYNGGGNWDIAHTIASQNIIFKTTPSGGSATQRIRVSHNGDISFYEDTGTTAKLFWDASAERLSIGSSSPAATLDVVKTGAGIQDTLQLRNAQTLAAGVGSSLGFGDSGGARLAYIAGAATGANNDNGYLSFYTRASDSLAERMRIDSSGRVGIGVTPSSGTQLEVGNSTNSSAVSRVTNGTVSVDLTASSSGKVFLEVGTNHPLVFATNATERARIDSSGNVGIGTSSPEETLSVMGDFQVALNTSVTGRGLKVSTSNTSITDDTVSINAQASTGILAFQTNSTERARIDSSGHLIVKNGGRFYLESSSGFSPFLSESSNNLLFTVNSSERMRIDSSGNLLVGKTAANFTVAGHEIKPGGFAGFTRDGGSPIIANRLTSDGDIIEFYRGSTSVGSIGTLNTNRIFFGGADTGFMIASDLDCIYPTNGGDTARDNAVDLGNSGTRFKDLYLSGTAYSAALNVDGGSSGIINFGDVTSNYGRLYADSTGTYVGSVTANPLILRTTNTERARIDSSGNLLVGKTNNTLSNDGTIIRAGGEILVTNTSDIVANFNRTGTDGSIVTLYKDGSTVGSIGSRSGAVSYIVLDPRTSVKGAALIGGSVDANEGIINPGKNDGDIADAAISFGTASSRFKDLYLSGGVYLGGTGSANKLDDYEEGTFTPTIATGTVTYTAQRGRYTKIGRVVHIHGFVQVASISGSSSTNIIAGLPFIAKNDGNYSALASKTNGFDWGGSSTMITFQVTPNSANISAVGSGNNQAFRDINSSGLAANDWIAFTGYYVTDS